MDEAASIITGSARYSEAMRLRRLAFRAFAAFAAVLGLNLWVSGLALDVRGSEWAIALLALLILGGAAASRADPASRAGAAASGAGLMLTFSILGAALSMVVLRWGMPQADAALLAADARIGIDVPNMIGRIAEEPVVTAILHTLYGTSIPLLLLTTMALGLLGQAERMWRACLMFGATLLTVCLGSGLFPAKGAFLFLGPDTIARLPENAGTYAFETFDLFAFGSPGSLSLASLNGVACFPSFHTAAALILCQAGWTTRRLRGPLCLWGGLVIFSTIPIGGHYVVDLLAGAAVFAAWSWATRPRASARAAPVAASLGEGALVGA